jgi:hypothetical protein
VYSEVVRQGIRTWLDTETASGRGIEAAELIRLIHRRLEMYPQFGDPLEDLLTPGETLWIGCVSPVFLRYIIDEGRRLVIIVNPFVFRPPPHAGP